MINKPLWDECIHHRGLSAEQFVEEFFAPNNRKVMLVGGAGFDTRSHFVAESIAAVCGDRVTGIFIREERPNPSKTLIELAEKNVAAIEKLVENITILPVDVFGSDGAPVGGRRATKELSENMDLNGITDLILDCSALSVGLMFPIARYCHEAAKNIGKEVNFHIFVLDDPSTDSAIQSTSCGKVAPLHTFGGKLNLDSRTDAAKLWLPQLGAGRREVLNLIFQDISACGMSNSTVSLSNPRTGDKLMEEYGDLFETITDPMTPTWHVDSRDLVYAHEKNPLDLYRSVLIIDDARTRVFSETGGSQLILSPLGSKAVALGLLMAALERSFAVVSVESIDYHIDPNAGGLTQNKAAELVHIWMHGQAYQQEADE